MRNSKALLPGTWLPSCRHKTEFADLFKGHFSPCNPGIFSEGSLSSTILVALIYLSECSSQWTQVAALCYTALPRKAGFLGVLTGTKAHKDPLGPDLSWTSEDSSAKAVDMEMQCIMLKALGSYSGRKILTEKPFSRLPVAEWSAPFCNSAYQLSGFTDPDQCCKSSLDWERGVSPWSWKGLNWVCTKNEVCAHPEYYKILWLAATE